MASGCQPCRAVQSTGLCKLAERGVVGRSRQVGRRCAASEPSACPPSECRDVLLPLLADQLSGQLDDNASRPDHEASSQLLSNILEVLDRKDVVS